MNEHEEAFRWLAMGQFALAAGAPAEGQWKSWVQERSKTGWFEVSKENVREDSGQQDGKFWPCLPNNVAGS